MFPVGKPSLAALTTVLAVGGAHAQQSTSATYDSWIMQCQLDAASSPHKTCGISQVSYIKENSTPFSRLLVGKPASGKPVVITAQVPVNVMVRTPLTLKLDDADPGVAAPIDKCVPAGCFADFEIKDDYLKKLRAADGNGRLGFKNASGRDVSAPVSFKGFHAALEALTNRTSNTEGE
jgi:invasion protein IalB